MASSAESIADSLVSGGSGSEMVVVRAGRFRMECLPGGDYQCTRGRPIIDVEFPAAFAISVHEVTFDLYDRYLTRTQRSGVNEAEDYGWGRGDCHHPRDGSPMLVPRRRLGKAVALNRTVRGKQATGR